MVSGWSRMIPSKLQFWRNIISIPSKSMKKLLRLWGKFLTLSGNLKNKLINFMLQVIILNSRRSFQILKISSFCSIPTLNMIFAGTGKNWKKDLLILSSNTTRQLRVLRCIITPHLKIFLESSPKSPGFWENFLTSRPTTLLSLGILSSLGTERSLRILVFWASLEI